METTPIDELAAYLRNGRSRFEPMREDIGKLAKNIPAELKRRVQEASFATILRDCVADIYRSDRQTLKRAAAALPPQRTARGANEAASAILDTWRVGSILLGDCTRTELLAAADEARACADGHLHNERFYRMIAARLGTSRMKVRSVLADADAMEILRKTGEVKAQAA